MCHPQKIRSRTLKGHDGGNRLTYQDNRAGLRTLPLNPMECDNHGSVLAPVPVAPVHETDMMLLPEGLQALKKVAKEVGLDLRGAYLNLDGGFDSAHNRKCIFNAGLIPNFTTGHFSKLL